MPTYTKTNNAVATYGEESAAVGALQTQLNAQNAGKPGYKPLVVDNKYGPLTLAATKSPAIVGTNDIHKAGAKNSADLNALIASFGASPEAPTNPKNDPNSANYTDSYIEGLTGMASRSDAATQRLIANVEAQRQRNANKVDTQYDNYKSGLQLLGIQHNDAQFTPDLLQGHLQQAENEHTQKIQDLDAELNKAIADATDAQANNDFKILDEKMKYIKELKKAQKDEIGNMYDTLSKQSKAAGEEAHQIYDTLNTLNADDQETFLHAIAKKFNIPIGSLVQSLADEKAKRETEDVKIKNAKATLAKKSTTGGGGTATFKISKGIATLTPQFESIKGADNYIDPYEWVKARTAWNNQGGTDASFNTSFKKYLNPKSYKLAGFKVTTSGGGRGGN